MNSTYTCHDTNLIAAVQFDRPPWPGTRRYYIARRLDNGTAPLMTVWAVSKAEAKAVEREYRVRIEGKDNAWLRRHKVVGIVRNI